MSKGKMFPRLMALLLICLFAAGCQSASTDAANPPDPGGQVSAADGDDAQDGPGTSDGKDAAQAGGASNGSRDNTPEVLIPSADGTVTYGNELATIDASHADEGYIMVKYTGTKEKVKLLITVPGFEKTYQYTFRSNDFETFPLTGGSGTYTLEVRENVGGNNYALAYKLEEQFTINSDLTPFLYPNQYVNFTEDTKAVDKGTELAQGADTDLDVVASVYNYVVDNVTYDTDKAEDSERLKLYLPDPDETLDTKKGICFDYAALMVTMLRTQRIPTRLEIGYAGTIYHAWISTYVDDIGWVDGIIQFEKDTWTMMDPTFASTGKGDKATEEYITDKSNYQTIFIY